MSEEILAGLAEGLLDGRIHVVDLTQPLGEDTPVIALPPEIGKNSPGFTRHNVSNFDENGPGWYWNAFTMGEHCGTHFDAPAHWHTGRENPSNSTDTLDVQRLVGPACVIDVSDKAAADDDYLLTVTDIEEWEAAHGRIPARSWVLMRTDWSKRTDPESFLNGGRVPGPSLEAARYLAEERDILGFGVEQVGTDAGVSGGFDPPFPAHHFMHKTNRFGLASLANLDQLPPKGAIVIAPPLKIVAGSGSPVRVIALVGT